jgi:poly [ADP-ribose] polymerase
MLRYAYLVNVDGAANHNKFYEAVLNDDYSIDVKYGRVGQLPAHHHYNSNEKSFSELVQSKVNKGYTDETALHSVKEDTCAAHKDLSYEPIPDSVVNELVEELIKSSRDFMKSNYTVTLAEITQKMIDEAENDIDDLVDIANNYPASSVYAFNKKLEELYADIPRKMRDVSSHLLDTNEDKARTSGNYTSTDIAKTTAAFERIIRRERDMLDNIRGQLIPALQQSSQTKDGTVLDAYGLSISEATYKQEDEITMHLGIDYNGLEVERRFVRAFAVENNQTRQNYENFKQQHNLSQKDCALFYHGSKVENWFSIMKQGLSLNPDAKITGKMFGNGLYFAPDARKSLNYMDVKGSCWNNGKRDSGYMAVYAVALGKCYMPKKALSETFNKDELKYGCLSVYADKRLVKLENDEYIVYDQSQCTIKYLLEMTKSDVRGLSFNLDRKVIRNSLDSGFEKLERSPSGLIAELNIPKLSQTVFSELFDKALAHYDVDRLFFEYDIKQDKISFVIQDSDGVQISTELPEITRDDRKFLMREMKKSFADSEPEWRKLAEQSEKEKVGAIVATNKHSSQAKEERPRPYQRRRQFTDLDKD